jgi:hypothetical protein
MSTPLLRRLLVALGAIAALLALFAACDSSDSDAPADREQELRDAIDAAFTAFQDGDVEEFYAFFSEEFHERCDEDDFRDIMAVVRVFISSLDDVELRVEDIEFEGDDHATANIFIDGDGGDGFSASDDDDGFLDTWTREDGEWKTDIDDPEPCDLSVDTGEDDDEDTPVVSGPGTSREEAVEIGETVMAGDLEVTVTGANLDAEEEVLAISEFSDPPRAGQRYVLARVRVRHAGEGPETISVSSSDFKITGSANILYDGFGDSSCGFFDGQIDGEMFPGGEIEGTVCFQIPVGEGGLILVAQPFVSFDDEDRRFIALE